MTQPDAIVPDPYNSQDWNRYSYVRNNPLKYKDPNGHWPIPNGFSISFNLSNIVNSIISSSGIITSTDAAQAFDIGSTYLDTAALAIDESIAIGDVAALTIGGVGGAAASAPDGGMTAPETGAIGAVYGVLTFEASPFVRGATIGGNVLSSIATIFTGASDVITGETNITGAFAASSSGAQFTSSVSIGRDSLTSGAITGLGWISPIGWTSAPLAAAAVDNDTGHLYVGPFSKVPKSFTLSTSVRSDSNGFCFANRNACMK